MTKTYHGSCHCGAVKFAADIDLEAGTSKCNCSMCTKTRLWKAIVKAEAFRLLQGEEALAEYRFGSHNLRHVFCRHCGVKPFGSGHLDGFGDFVAVSLACLDDAHDKELAEAPVAYEDGRNNNWAGSPSETRYL
jgi:hypothetical protein